MTIYSKGNHPPGFYVYAYLREDGTPYYIGKGKNKRAWAKSRTVDRPLDPSRIIITHVGLTEVWALAMERWYIRWYGRKDNGTGILRNFTDGGDGVTGRPMTDKDREKISKAKLGKSIWTNEDRKRMSTQRSGKRHWNYGSTLTPETTNKISLGLKKYYLVNPQKVKEYILVDTHTGQETVFSSKTENAVLKPLKINRKELLKVARHHPERLYKKRYTVKF